MTIAGMDYSDWRPGSVSDLDGAVFVCRYLSNDQEKNLTRAEAETLTSWGVQIVANWESTGTGGDYSQGVADAQTARSQALSAGMPAGRPIYFSIDEDVSVASQLGYFQGVGSVLPRAEVGVYGSAQMIQGIQAAGWAEWGWLTMSKGWSGGADTSGCQLNQTQGGAGGNFDWDEALADDYGQWNLNTAAAPATHAPTIPTAKVTPTSEEDDDMSQQSDNGLALVTWATGSKHVLQFFFDGAQGNAPTLRVDLGLTSGPLVFGEGSATNPWLPGGRIVYEIPAGFVPNAFGVSVKATNEGAAPFSVLAA